MNEAAKIWYEAIKETGIWLSPFADNVADLGQLIIPRMQQALDAARAGAWSQGFEAAKAVVIDALEDK